MIRCLIVDDEQLARDLLASYAQIPGTIEVVASCANCIEAAEILRTRTIDLLLLDIEMPGISGIDFLRSLEAPPLVVFITAYAGFALESYELNTIDYLLKPIGLSRFNAAIEKVKSTLSLREKAVAYDLDQTDINQSITIKEGRSRHQILVKDIFYLSSMKEYIVYHTSTGKRMELKPMHQAEEELGSTHFLRIHRSYLVAKSAINGIQNKAVLLKNGNRLPVGKTYWKMVKQLELD